MIIRTERDNSHRMVHLVGRFDAHETAGFRSAVSALLDGSGDALRLDLSQVAFVDSSALAELARLHKAAQAAGDHVILVAPSDPVRVILEITDLADVFTIEHEEST